MVQMVAHHLAHAAADPLRNTVQDAERVEQDAAREREQAELKLLTARQASRAARETFSNWIATRHATAQPDHGEGDEFETSTPAPICCS